MSTDTTTKYVARFDGSVDLAAPAEVAFGDEVAFSGVARVVASGLREGLFGDITHSVTLDVRSLAGIAGTAPVELEAPVDEPAPEPDPVQVAVEAWKAAREARNAAPAPRRRLAWLREDIACPRWAILLVTTTAALSLLTGCGIAETDRHPAPRWVVQDCKAALRLVVTDQGEIPAKPKACENVSPGQYKGAVADVTRPYRIPEA